MNIYYVHSSKDHVQRDVPMSVVVAASPSRAKTLARKTTHRMRDDDYINMRAVKARKKDLDYLHIDESVEHFVQYYPTYQEELDQLRYHLDWPY